MPRKEVNFVTQDKEPKLSLKIGPLKFSGISVDRKVRGLVLAWIADTEVSNIVFVRFLKIGFRLPPVQLSRTFASRDILKEE